MSSPPFPDVNVLLDDLGAPKVPDRLAAVLIASTATSSQEVALVPMTSITRPCS
jgi:hypothetical protein